MKEEVEEQEIQKVEKIISFEIFVFVLNLFEFSRTKIFLFKKPKDGDFRLISPVPYTRTERMTHVNSIHNTRKAHL